MATKHFVLIHDAGQGKWIWEKFKPLLQVANHVIATVDLKASGDDSRSSSSADEYTTQLQDVLKGLPEGDKVILVSHGCGGIIAAEAVFLNALLPDSTQRPSYVIEKDCEFGAYSINKGAISKIKLGPTFVREHLFPLSTVEDYEYAMSKIKTGSFFLEPLAVRENFTEAGYGSIPKVFISSQQDTAIPPKFQQWEIENFLVNKFCTLEGDHSPMYSDPKALRDKILEIIKELST